MKLLVALSLLCTAAPSPAGEWTKLPALPDREGFAGPFAGVSHGALLVAGGANFPDKKPWEGGKKVWYDTVFVLDRPEGEWKVAGKLPQPLGYGVSVSHRDSLICIGGSDAQRHYAAAFRLEWKTGKLITHKLPSLPQPVANACGAVVGEVVYVAGGIVTPEATDALKAVYKLNLADANAKWTTLEGFPGRGRMLAMAAGHDGKLWLFGGVDLSKGSDSKPQRHYLNDAYTFAPATGWTRITDMPSAMAAAPTPAPADARGIWILGGDDGRQVGVKPTDHRGFTKTILRYDPTAAKWIDAGELDAPRVTTASVLWNQSWVVPSGEARPGIRSPDVWRWTNKP